MISRYIHGAFITFLNFHHQVSSFNLMQKFRLYLVGNVVFRLVLRLTATLNPRIVTKKETSISIDKYIYQ